MVTFIYFLTLPRFKQTTINAVLDSQFDFIYAPTGLSAKYIPFPNNPGYPG